MAGTNADKLMYSLIAAFVFFIISHPIIYGLTDRIFGVVGVSTSIAGCPTTVGMVLHTLVFALIIRMLM